MAKIQMKNLEVEEKIQKTILKKLHSNLEVLNATKEISYLL